MDQDAVHGYLMAKHKATLGYPFGPDVAVYKVMNKMFATLTPGRDSPHYWLNLKCDPNEAQVLRDIFPAIRPGYHMSKSHWNTVVLDCSVPAGEIRRMIDNSYQLIVESLPRKAQRALEEPD